MSYLVLARKYRPQTFEEVIGQAHVTETLANAVTSGRVAHAILFSGPRGTGKTTIARILAKAMNCEKGPTPIPCNACRSCKEITGGSAADVFEIDGASNNSVDQVRELRGNVKYMPAFGKYKIYIIDEVHMLSMAAFNALLKTLEEPPAHVLFFFATTEIHKIPITILSRCQRHDLRRINLEQLIGHMASLCAQEKVEIGAESLDMIAREADGSVRDSLSILDQIISCSEGSVTDQMVLDILGVIDRKIIFEMSAAVFERDMAVILKKIAEIYDRGQDIRKLYSSLVEHFRNLLVIKLGADVETLVDLPAHERRQMTTQVAEVSQIFLNQVFDLLVNGEGELRISSQPKMTMEMLFFRFFQSGPSLPVDALITKLDQLQERLGETGPATAPMPATQPLVAPSSSSEPPGETDGQPPGDIPEKPAAGIREEQAGYENRWDSFVAAIIKKYPSLGGSLTRCSLRSVSNGKMTIETEGNGFLLKMVTKKKDLIAGFASEFFDRELTIDIVSTGKTNGRQKKQQSENNHRERKALEHPLVSDAIEIFNGTVVDVTRKQED